MKLVKHFTQQPFVFATGLAALIHSTWSLGTFFSGEQPHEPVQMIMWLIPALLIAFSLDVGQIVTSAEIRAGQRSRAKYLTFAVFAGATYFLQFVYMASHMPQIALAPGIRPEWGVLISYIRDSGVFVIPALLPLSTLLYTFSQQHDAQPSTVQDKELDSDPALSTVVEIDGRTAKQQAIDEAMHAAGIYDSVDDMERAESEGEAAAVLPFASSNGHKRFN